MSATIDRIAKNGTRRKIEHFRCWVENSVDLRESRRYAGYFKSRRVFARTSKGNSNGAGLSTPFFWFPIKERESERCRMFI